MPLILPQLPPEGPWTVLGLMSGTSADGADAVLARVDPRAFAGGRPFLAFLGHLQRPYAPELRETVLAAAGNRLDPAGLCILQRRLGEHHRDTALALVEASGQRPHLASLHGQTVQHHPAQGATLQLADPYLLALALDCPVAWDLRRMDMALGGQGAPMVPLTELWLHGDGAPWGALNLGGIANVTLWDGHEIRAWDLGPAMSLLDLAARRWMDRPFDPGGQSALGPACPERLARWLTHPYFQAPPPKSTGRESFGEAWLAAEAPDLERLPLPGRLATLAAFSAAAAAAELGRWAPALPAGSPLHVSGGGTLHARVLAELTGRLPTWRVAIDDRFPTGAREALSWALLGAASAAGRPGNLPGVTGARRPAVLGSWTLP